MKKLLAIDVGNSNVKYGFFVKGKLQRVWKHPRNETSQQAGKIITEADAPVAMASVVPETGAVIAELSGKRLLLEVRSENQSRLSGLDPEMGADRIADAVAASVLYGRKKRASVVMSFGTASTLLALSKDARVVGGWIGAGLSSQLESMHERCALLPLLNMEGGSLSLGTDTETHMRNGVFVANLGAAREWIRVASAQLACKTVSVATGGWARTLQEHGRVFDVVDETLTLKGVCIIASDFARTQALD